VTPAGSTCPASPAGVTYLKSKKNMKSKFDLSILTLLVSNLVTAYLAVTQHWPLVNLLWVYWFQSVTIGLFTVLRIITTKNDAVAQMIDKEHSTNSNPIVLKVILAVFFLVHFGLFHLVYAAFLSAGSLFWPVMNGFKATEIIVPAIVFFVNHLFSYLYHRGEENMTNIFLLFFFPYARILPMHLTILLLGLFSSVLMPLFLILKTLADLLMHVAEHAKYQQIPVTSAAQLGGKK
jgi:hypothetical protein